MTIARQAAKNTKRVKCRWANVVGKVFPPMGGKEKHFNFRPQGKDNVRGGLYYGCDE